MAKPTKKQERNDNKGLVVGMMIVSLIGAIIVYFAVYSFVLFAVGLACFGVAWLLYKLHVARGGKTFAELASEKADKAIGKATKA